MTVTCKWLTCLNTRVDAFSYDATQIFSSCIYLKKHLKLRYNASFQPSSLQLRRWSH